MTFRCGHPKEGNTYTRRHDGHESCAFCRRMWQMARAAERAQDRINKRRSTLGERICAGLA